MLPFNPKAITCYHGFCTDPEICPEFGSIKKTMPKRKCPKCCFDVERGCRHPDCIDPEICPAFSKQLYPDEGYNFLFIMKLWLIQNIYIYISL